jgi:hypothetical protein
MRTLIHVQPPYDVRADHFDPGSGPEFATVNFEGDGQQAVLFLRSRADCDKVIRVLLQAKDMFPTEYPEQPPPDAGDTDPGSAS